MGSDCEGLGKVILLFSVRSCQKPDNSYKVHVL